MWIIQVSAGTSPAAQDPSALPLWALILGSSVLAALLTQALSIGREVWIRHRDRRFSALYTALTLEDYANACTDVSGDIVNFEASDGQVGGIHTTVADMPAFGDEIDWKTVGIRTTAKIQEFRVHVHMTQTMLNELADIDGEQACGETREESIRLGRKALALATEIRNRYGLPPAVLGNEHWSVKEYLDAEWQKIEARNTPNDPAGNTF